MFTLVCICVLLKGFEMMHRNCPLNNISSSIVTKSKFVPKNNCIDNLFIFSYKKPVYMKLGLR